MKKLSSLIAGALFLCSAMAGIARAQNSEEDAWKILQTGMTTSNSYERATAVRVLGLLPGDPRAVEMAENALQDKEPVVRAVAATALAQMGSKKSTLKIRELFKDTDAGVVIAAAHALKQLGDEKGYAVYYAILTGERKTGQGLVGGEEDALHEQMRIFQDKKKMADFGFEQGIGYAPYGGIAMSVFHAVTKDDVSPLRAGAALALANDPDPRTGVALGKAASDPKEMVRAAALHAIALRGDPKLLPDVLPNMTDKDDVVRYAAAAAFVRLSDVAKQHSGK